jgi:hypothetical protein
VWIFVAELFGALMGSIPDSPTWLRRLVGVLYFLLFVGCFVGVVLVMLGALR